MNMTIEREEETREKVKGESWRSVAAAELEGGNETYLPLPLVPFQTLFDAVFLQAYKREKGILFNWMLLKIGFIRELYIVQT